MEELGLGPSGGLMYCIQHLEENLDDWFTEELDNYLDDDYFVFDYPGKISFLWYGPTPGLIITSLDLFKDVFNKLYDFRKGRLSPLSKYVALGIVKYDGDKWAKQIP
ncbi:hypothetical protein QN277_023204 [Acacia crassicarpa]|uniref:GPN-loop GTPase 3 n=1 Tax=Acacia crassicarpa TaxID=499986 RepID=A0AAE1KCQ1_9FABA|nr:hypothetical protein QN277_023204 [Acacia crassicarpa]